MIEPTKISSELQSWGKLAGYTAASGSRAEDGRAIFSASLGEIRLLIGRGENGLFVITDSDRLGPEQFILAAPSIGSIERYLYGRFGLEMRGQHGLPRVKVPVTVEDVSPGFSIEMRVFDAKEHWALIASDRTLVAIGSTDQISGTADLVKLSLYLTATIDEIRAAALDPNGKPLFRLREF